MSSIHRIFIATLSNCEDVNTSMQHITILSICTDSQYIKNTSLHKLYFSRQQKFVLRQLGPYLFFSQNNVKKESLKIAGISKTRKAKRYKAVISKGFPLVIFRTWMLVGRLACVNK